MLDADRIIDKNWPRCPADLRQTLADFLREAQGIRLHEMAGACDDHESFSALARKLASALTNPTRHGE